MSSTKKFTVLHVAIIGICASAITYFAIGFRDKKETTPVADAKQCNVNVQRLSGYQYIKPLLFVDDQCESESLMAFKNDIISIIEVAKKTGAANTASVYFKDLRGSGWISVNPDEQYEPGSLFKVAELIAILKMEEDDPGFLDSKVTYSIPYPDNRKLLFPSKKIEFKKTYSIRQLLEYMIKYSDNEATFLLEQHTNIKILQKIFSDIGLEVPDITARHYYFTAPKFSLLMRSIYNASYLNIKNSEYAAELLGESEFKDGLLKELPKGTKIIHKFGEAGTTDEIQLHESGIIYLNNRNYVITVMLKGRDVNRMSDVISKISASAYQQMSRS